MAAAGSVARPLYFLRRDPAFRLLLLPRCARDRFTFAAPLRAVRAAPRTADAAPRVADLTARAPFRDADDFFRLDVLRLELLRLDVLRFAVLRAPLRPEAARDDVFLLDERRDPEERPVQAL